MKLLAAAILASTIIASESSAQTPKPKPDTVTVTFSHSRAQDGSLLKAFRSQTERVDTASIAMEQLWVRGDTVYIAIRQDATTTRRYRFARVGDVWVKQNVVEVEVQTYPPVRKP